MLTIKVRAYRETAPKWCFKVTPQRVKHAISCLIPTVSVALQRRSVRRGGNKKNHASRTTLGPPCQARLDLSETTQLRRIHAKSKLKPNHKWAKKYVAIPLQTQSLSRNRRYGPNGTGPEACNVRFFCKPRGETLYLV